jgi:Arc/MetJ-type ribon-helix-helix transcriptional regulator
MKRITMEVPDSVRERLDRLKVMSEAASITEVVRRALRVYELLLEADLSGSSVLLEDSDGRVRQVVVR